MGNYAETYWFCLSDFSPTNTQQANMREKKEKPMSGLGMSRLGMPGLGMSGLGMSGLGMLGLGRATISFTFEL